MKTMKDLTRTLASFGFEDSDNREHRIVWACVEEILDNIRNHYKNVWESDRETPLSFVTQEHALSGAKDWKTYSWGGSSMCYNSDIIAKYNCETFPIPAMIKALDSENQEKDHNHPLNVQAFFLGIAWCMIKDCAYWHLFHEDCCETAAWED